MSPYKNPADERARRVRARTRPFNPTTDELGVIRDRLLSKVVAGVNGCWIFTGYLNPAGYGNFGFGPKVKLAHRVSYELLVGPIPEGLTLDHQCNVPRCVNPAHLEPATHRENILRGTSASARNARKTHCDYGHEFTPENTYWYLGKWRNCRECARRKARDHHRRKKAAA